MTQKDSASPPPADSDWAFALEYYPDLSRLTDRLASVSDTLPSEYRKRLLSSRNFAARAQLASIVENEYCEKLFGKNSKLVDFARALLAQGQRDAVRELGRAVALFGENDPEAIIGRIRGKYFLFQTAAGETCTPDCIRILRAAVEQGYTITVAPNNSITLTKIGRGQTHLHSIEHILRFAHFLKPQTEK